MEYQTHDGVRFEFPDELKPLVNEAVRAGRYECSQKHTVWIPIEELTSPARNPGTRWFERERLEAVLRGFTEHVDLPPVEVHKHPESGHLLVRNGFHRYYAAVAARIHSIPCIVSEYFDITAT